MLLNEIEQEISTTILVSSMSRPRKPKKDPHYYYTLGSGNSVYKPPKIPVPSSSSLPKQFDSSLSSKTNLKFSQCMTAVSFPLGYVSALSSQSHSTGSFYLEFTLLNPYDSSFDIPLSRPPDSNPVSNPFLSKRQYRREPAWRIGFATKFVNPRAPIGYDCFGYSIKSIDGCPFHLSRSSPTLTQSTSLKSGDVIGLYLYLAQPDSYELAELAYRSPKPIDVFTLEGWRTLSRSLSTPMPINSSHSLIGLFVNGKYMGNIAEGLFGGPYHAACSGFMGAQISMNLTGPFKFPPKSDFIPTKPKISSENDIINPNWPPPPWSPFVTSD